jgi:benzoate membrane transport protein
MQRFWADVSVSAVVAGFVAVLVGYTSSVAIVFAAAQALGASPAVATSWMWALGLGMGLTCIGMALATRQPLLTAWSTPGAALLAATQGVGLAEATGAFMVSAALVVLVGATRLFERVMDRIPMALASALLAGVLARFALDAVGAVRTAPLLVLPMALALLAGRRWWPRYAVPGVLAVGMGVAGAQGTLALGTVAWQWATPVWTTPVLHGPTLVGVALPLFVVNMASQNLPGLATQRAAGYATPVSGAITTTGLATLVLAPLGGFGITLAAITAAICNGPEAHPNPARRYTAVVAAGLLYTLLGLAGGAVVGLLAAFPRELVVAVAGLALLGTITGALQAAMAEPAHRDAAGLTFLVTLSGVTLLGVGAAFWGLVVGAVALWVLRRR